MNTQKIVDTIPRAKDANNQEKKTTQNPSPPDNSFWWFQFFVATFTGVLAIVGVFQVILIFGTLKATKNAANAANESASLQKTAMIDTQRPFVFLTEMAPSMHLDQHQVPDQFVFSPRLLNSGKTPALNAWGFVYPRFFDGTTIDDNIIPDMPPLNTIKKSIIFLGPSIKGLLNDIIITPQEAMAIWKKEKRLFIWVIIEYSDMFKGTEVHHTNYCVEIVLVSDPSQPVADIHGSHNLFRLATFWKYNSAD